MKLHKYAGHRICLIKINGWELVVPKARVYVASSCFTGFIRAVVISLPIFSVILGYVPGVKHFSATEAVMQTTSAAVI